MLVAALIAILGLALIAWGRLDARMGEGQMVLTALGALLLLGSAPTLL